VAAKRDPTIRLGMVHSRLGIAPSEYQDLVLRVTASEPDFESEWAPISDAFIRT
jgi:hypothetical protein